MIEQIDGLDELREAYEAMCEWNQALLKADNIDDAPPAPKYDIAEMRAKYPIAEFYLLAEAFQKQEGEEQETLARIGDRVVCALESSDLSQGKCLDDIIAEFENAEQNYIRDRGTLSLFK